MSTPPTPRGGGTDMLTPYIGLIAQAVLPIVLGSLASVKTPAAIRTRLKSRSAIQVLDPDEDDDDEDDGTERLGMSDSLLFPVFGSMALLSIFLALKYLGSEWINWIMGIYFALAGVASFHMAFSHVLDGLAAYTPLGRSHKYHLRIEKGFKQVFHLALSPTSLLVLPLSILVPALHIYLARPWYLTNLLSFSFAHSAIRLLRLDGFRTGAALLMGLFVYDVFWVFGTPVMVTVAKGLDAPIKVLAPKDLGDLSAGFSMLGLGDIVVPGLFISLALRFDYAQFVARTLKKNPDALPTSDKAYPKPYFWAVMVGYVAGLATTMGVMHVFRAAQPALLYLSPACIGSVALLALARGELSTLLKWSDEDAEEGSGGSSQIKEAERIAAEDAKGEKTAPQITNTQSAPTPALADAPAAAAVVSDGDDEWMKLDDTSKGSDGKTPKKKGGKKKR